MTRLGNLYCDECNETIFVKEERVHCGQKIYHRHCDTRRTHEAALDPARVPARLSHTLPGVAATRHFAKWP